MQLVVSDGALFAGFVAFPDDGGLVAFGLEVSVEAVVGDVGLAAFEPLDGYGSFADVVVELTYSVPLLKPVVLVGFFCPESFGI